MPYYFGSTAKMLEMDRKIRFIAKSVEPVLIEGESGAGKQTLAQYLHHASSMPGQLLRIVCGHQSVANHLDDFEAPGTVFLKHVHLLPAALQERLLLALEYDGAGGRRLICSAYEGLEQLVSKGDFLPELFYRITAYRVLVPPLRERSRDIPELFGRMMEEMQNGGERQTPPPSTAVMEALCGYSWPGNLRELRNTVRNYLLAPNADSLMSEIGGRSTAQASGKTDEAHLALKDQVRRASRRLEAEIILRTLERYRWNRRRTAQSLKISYRSLLYKMKECNIRGDVDESGAIQGEHLSQTHAVRVSV
jgi:DNA-binding NtrC family response regulator